MVRFDGFPTIGSWEVLRKFLAIVQLESKDRNKFSLKHCRDRVRREEKKKRFKRNFVALKPCIDGFLAGCRPFIGVDASALHGRYTG